MALALFFAFERAGRSMLAKIAMIAITTNSSMSVNADLLGFKFFMGFLWRMLQGKL